jgi:hypothetical protein
VHAGIQVLQEKELLRLPIGLCLQILDLPLFAGPWSAPSEPFLGFIEAGVSVNFFWRSSGD